MTDGEGSQAWPDYLRLRSQATPDYGKGCADCKNIILGIYGGCGIENNVRTIGLKIRKKWQISSSVTWILSINTLKMQTTQCQLEYITSTSVLPASTSMSDVSNSSSTVC